MKSNTIRCFSMIVMILSLSACSAINDPKPPHNQAMVTALSSEAQHAYEEGDLIVAYALSDGLENTEAYADWAAYLNEFKASHEGEAAYERILPGQVQCTTPSTDELTVFLKRGQEPLLYQGFIVEPQVYRAVVRYFEGRVLSDMDRAFLPSPCSTTG